MRPCTLPERAGWVATATGSRALSSLYSTGANDERRALVADFICPRAVATTSAHAAVRTSAHADERTAARHYVGGCSTGAHRPPLRVTLRTPPPLRRFARDYSSRGDTVTSLPGSFTSDTFNRGILVCPEGRAVALLGQVTEPRVSSLVRVGTAGMLWAGETSDPRGPRQVIVLHANEVLDGPPGWDKSWTIVTAEPLAVHDLDGRPFGAVTSEAGTFLCRSRLVSGCERPGDEWYTPDGWVLEVVMLQPSTGTPRPDRWWESQVSSASSNPMT
jgi:hypothetical protein